MRNSLLQSVCAWRGAGPRSVNRGAGDP